MIIKFLHISNSSKAKHLINLENFRDIECINLDNCNLKISEIRKLNLPFNLKHIIIDLSIIEEERNIEEDRNNYSEFNFKTHSEAIQFIKDLAEKFKLPYNCKISFRFDCRILYNDFGTYEFVYSGDKIIYDSFIDKYYMGKISKSYSELKNIIDNQLKNYKKDEIFEISCKYIDRFCKLINDKQN